MNRAITDDCQGDDRASQILTQKMQKERDLIGAGMDGNFMKGFPVILIFLCITGIFATIAGCATSTPQAAGPSARTGTASTGGNVEVNAVPDLTNRNSPLAAAFTTYPSVTKLGKDTQPVGLRFVAGGFTAPMVVADPHDGSGRLFVVDQTGYVKIFYMNGTVLDLPFLDVRDRLVTLNPAYDERGLLSIAFHPQFASNGRVFAYYSAPLRAGADPNWSCTNRLSEFHISATDPNRVDMATEKILLQVDKPYQNHNGGTLLFGPDDGYLYLPLGDGGRADDTGMGHTPGIGNGQDLTSILGKVIRIDADKTSPGKPYAIPPDNPFLSNSTILPEIYAYGFRNPAYATFDSGGSHRMFIAMAGQRLFESVFIIYKGGNYPWNIREGTHCFNPLDDSLPPAGSCPTTGYNGKPLIGPVAELGHDVGDTIVGGVVYRGTLMPSLVGTYIYGTWSDESRTAGNGTLLVSTPPAGLDPAALPDDSGSLTSDKNAMWTTRIVSVANNRNGRINAFVRGLSEDNNHEVLVLINRNGGPGLTPQGSGEIWQMVPASTPGLVSTTTRQPAGPAPAATLATGTLAVTSSADLQTSVPATSAPSATTQITLTARNFAFDTDRITVPAGSTVVMTFANNDAGIPHNFALYTDKTAKTKIFAGDLVTGIKTVTYTFTAPSAPGDYFFRCDVHPELMTGTFIVT
jgi:glucose/arabinose dehydrogenase/plastocyanin